MPKSWHYKWLELDSIERSRSDVTYKENLLVLSDEQEEQSLL
jgi:hypothetical protein